MIQSGYLNSSFVSNDVRQVVKEAHGKESEREYGVRTTNTYVSAKNGKHPRSDHGRERANGESV